MGSRLLHLANNLSLPLETVTQTIAILAKRRVGKSYLMRKLVELLFKAGQQVVLVDPKGDQWGVRSSADGKGPGLPFVILGGERGDVPIEPGAGALIAKLIVEERISVLLDLSLLRKRELARFMGGHMHEEGFLEVLYRLKAHERFRTPMMLVLDEADAIGPQKPDSGEERMLGAAEDIVRRGGQRGLGCVLVTQRSAVLNKNLLTQAEVLVALRTIAPQDLAAMNAWIDVHGTIEQKRTLMASLPSLPVGDAWVWSPGWPTADGIFKRIHTLPIETFDSAATPRPGEKRVEPKTVADIDLDVLRRQMSETIERAKDSDPRELKRQLAARDARIADLERRGVTAPAPADPVPDSAALDRARHEGREETVRAMAATRRDLDLLLRDALRQVAQVRDHAQGLSRRVEGFATELGGGINELVVGALGRFSESIQAGIGKLPDMLAVPELQISPRGTSRVESTRAAPARMATSKPSNGDGHLGGGERRILTAAAQYPDGVTREQVSILTGYKRSSRDTYISRLVGMGYLEQRGTLVCATRIGVNALGAGFEPLPTGAALRDYWIERLPLGERDILLAVIKAHPSEIDRELITTSTGYKRSSRDTYLSRLSTRKLIETPKPGFVRAASMLF